MDIYFLLPTTNIVIVAKQGGGVEPDFWKNTSRGIEGKVKVIQNPKLISQIDGKGMQRLYTLKCKF
jgi:hypothetical protein